MLCLEPQPGPFHKNSIFLTHSVREYVRYEQQLRTEDVDYRNVVKCKMAEPIC